MNDDQRTERAEELRKMIEETGMSRKAIARLTAVMFTYIEGLARQEEDSYKFVYSVANNPEQYVTLMHKVALKNGEMESEYYAED